MTDTQSARWAQMREITPVTQRGPYFNCGWSGPLSVPVVDAMQQRLTLELEEGPTAKAVNDDRTATMERVRALTAQMMGADVDEIAITGNTTEGVNIAVNGIEIHPGDRVVTTDVEHGGGMVPAYWAREKRGAELTIVHCDGSEGPGEIIEDFDRAIDERTKLVILSEISYATGQLLPLAEIAKIAQARGANVVVDGAQTAGHVPIDVHALGVCAYAVPSHKWLCGPDGLGMLYVNRNRIPDLDPVKVSGRAAENYDFEGHFTYDRTHVTKFEVSTNSTPVAAGTAVALEQYLESGPQAVWDRVRALTRYAEQRFERIPGVELTGAVRDSNRSGLFLFKPGHLDPADVSGYLQGAAHIIARTVKQLGSIRFSLHVYNTEAEIDLAADVLESALRDGMDPALVAAGKNAFEA